MGIGHSEKKGRERAGEINRIRQIQLAQRRSEKKKKKDVKEMGYKPRNQTQSAREKKPRRKGKLSRKNKETEVGIAHVNEAGWPWRIKKTKNGGRVLEVSLCHCTACQPLAGSLPFR